ncbi:M10 family metallopeptidase C-terminal domain-containing protein, partial [Bradyrhizobium diazoefficiens]
MATAVNVSATNNAEIDGLLSGYKWSGTITYSFPDAPNDYANPYSGGDSEPTTSGFASAPTQIQAAINYAIGLILSYTNANIQYAGTNGADIMIAQSPAANPTAYAYYPGNYAPGGDVWFGTQYNFSLAKLGNYYFTTALHELGHAVGLKHSQEAGGPANVAVPSAHDDSEYTVMSYRSYVGASTTGGYTNEAYGYPQTYMANDILALQTMYGADYTTQSGNTVYTWNPTTGQEFINGVGQLAPGGGLGGSANRIYETVWDGGGVDTYDLSNYTTNLSINLNPGASSVFSSVQLAYLGDGHYASGNVYNAYLYSGDARSYIDNAIGGSGNDTIVGNAIANVLNGGSGNDMLAGAGGNDTIAGGAGTDTAVYSGNMANYAIAYNAATQTFIVVDQRAGAPDGTDTLTGIENFQFADTTAPSAALVSPPVSIEAVGATSLVQVGSNFYMNPAAGFGPTLKYVGSPVVAGQFGAWTPIAAEQTSSGYEVAWKYSGSDQFA